MDIDNHISSDSMISPGDESGIQQKEIHEESASSSISTSVKREGILEDNKVISNLPNKLPHHQHHRRSLSRVISNKDGIFALSLILAVTFSFTLLFMTVEVNGQVSGGIPFHSLRHFVTLRGRRQLQHAIISAAAGKFIFDNAKPKKGILPIPLPIPIPIPIEWEQPPVVIHPKTDIIPAPGSLKRTEDSKGSSTTASSTTTTTTPRPPPHSRDR